MARERRLSFGEVAERYDRARPSYPVQLIGDVLARTDPNGRLLEVGAGTGKATVLFAEHGRPVLALEPSAEMAAVARCNCARYAGIEVAEVEFERWDPGDERFALLYSGQAWHWIDAGVRYQRARQALSRGGVLAAFWNRVDWQTCSLREPLARVYAQAGRTDTGEDPMHPAAEPLRTVLDVDWTREISEAASGFGEPQVKSYRWPARYTAAEYVELLSTHSILLIDDPARRTALLDDVQEVISRNGGELRLTYVTELCVARAV